MKTEKNSTYKLGFGSRVPRLGSRVSGLGSHQQSRVQLFGYVFFKGRFFNTLIKLNQTHFDQFS